jgi:DNA-binding IclR family transcriptional regulator
MPTMARRKNTPRSVIGRVLAILAVFDVTHCALTLSEISNRSGLSMTTTNRLLAELNQARRNCS